MNRYMDVTEFDFGEGQAEQYAASMTFQQFMEQAQGLNAEETESLLSALEEAGTIFDISDMPRLASMGQAALRLREEMELAERDNLCTGLEKGDALRIYLEELEGQSGSEDSGDALLSGMKRVVQIAKEYAGYGVLLLDLIQEGNIGLWQVLREGEDLDNGAEAGIRQAMIRAILRQAVESGLSQKLRQAVEDYRMADERLLMDLGRNPTPEEMAEYLHMTVEEVENVRRTLENARMVDKAHVQPEPEEEEAEDTQAVEDTAYYQTRERVNDLMAGLTEYEKQILDLRYGLNGKPPLSLQETAQRLNMTTSRITEIEQTALAKMRGNQ